MASSATIVGFSIRQVALAAAAAIAAAAKG
jgi:hypothetical protein